MRAPDSNAGTTKGDGQRQEPARRLGEYTLSQRLGDGAVGETYVAENANGERVCLKVLRTDYQLPGGASYADRDLAIDSLRHEAQATSRFDHPNIPRLLDYGSARDVWFLAFELVEGANLWDIVSHHRKLAPEHVRAIGIQIASALHCAHSHDVLHRDIKPGNILLSKDGQAKLVDFGLAKLEASAATNFSKHVGTPRYWAPEQARFEPVTPRTDIYALGLVMVELLTGKHPIPFDPDSDDSLLAGTRGVDLDALDIPDNLRDTLALCLAPNPGERFQSALALETALLASSTRHPKTQLGAIASQGESARDRRAAFRDALPEDSIVPPPMSKRDPFRATTVMASSEEMARRAADGVPLRDPDHAKAVADLGRIAIATMGSRLEAPTLVRGQAESGRRRVATQEPPTKISQALPAHVEESGAFDLENTAVTRESGSTKKALFIGSAAAVIVATALVMLTGSHEAESAAVAPSPAVAARPAAAVPVTPAAAPGQEMETAIASAKTEEGPGRSSADKGNAAPAEPLGKEAETPRASVVAAAKEAAEPAKPRRARSAAKRSVREVRVGLIPAAQVLVDGRPVGPSPQTLKLSLGKHTIGGRIDGVTVTREVTVSETSGPVVLDLRDAIRR